VLVLTEIKLFWITRQCLQTVLTSQNQTCLQCVTLGTMFTPAIKDFTKKTVVEKVSKMY